MTNTYFSEGSKGREICKERESRDSGEGSEGEESKNNRRTNPMYTIFCNNTPLAETNPPSPLTTGPISFISSTEVRKIGRLLHLFSYLPHSQAKKHTENLHDIVTQQWMQYRYDGSFLEPLLLPKRRMISRILLEHDTPVRIATKDKLHRVAAQ